MLTTGFDDDATALWAENQTTALTAGVKDWHVPEYGSLEWLRTPAADPRRAAAVIEAAELWRRHTSYEEYLQQLGEYDPEAWWAEITKDADDYAVRIAHTMARAQTATELAAARANHRPVHELKAAPGWPPIAIPGRPGWYRHLIDGKQTDIDHNVVENAA